MERLVVSTGFSVSGKGVGALRLELGTTSSVYLPVVPSSPLLRIVWVPDSKIFNADIRAQSRKFPGRVPMAVSLLPVGPRISIYGFNSLVVHPVIFD